MSGAGAFALPAYLAVLLVQRAHELLRSRANERRLRSLGAREHAASDFPWLVALHVAWPLGLAAEVALGARPPAAWPVALLALAAAQALRSLAFAALGPLWTARVLVLPDHPRVRAGIFRRLAHPSYLAAALETLAAPLMFGAWRTALLATLVNAVLLARRIRAERRALAGARAA